MERRTRCIEAAAIKTTPTDKTQKLHQSPQERIRLDFLPCVERTIQPTGVVIDGIHYFHDVFRAYVGSTQTEQKRRFLFRRDPRDISAIFFWHPDRQQYTCVPYRNTSHPPISVWELRELRRKLQEAGRAHFDEQALFSAYERLREHEYRAVRTTKRIRRKRERRAATPIILPSQDPSSADTASLEIDFGTITPFGIEERA
jgi:putative transposase